jgi:HEAT repeats
MPRARTHAVWSLALAVALAVAVLTSGGPASASAPAPKAKVEELCKALVEDSNYKVRAYAATVLGRLGDTSAVSSLIKALSDPNKAVRGIAAQALGQIGDASAGDALRALLRTEADSFVKAQAEKAVLALNTANRGTPVAAAGGGGGKKIYLSFGPFTGTSKTIAPDAAKMVREALQRELGKLAVVTLALAPADQKNFARTGLLGFYVDGIVTRLDDAPSGGSSETSCDVKVQVLRWPSKSLISWTNAGASVQSGSRPRDKENARHDCLEASAGQLAEDLTKFFKSQGG